MNFGPEAKQLHRDHAALRKMAGLSSLAKMLG
jgi:hypothetical protein